ncbi:site-specific integrase [Pelagibacterium halotolerans]|uniref:Putative integrase/resolvase recombinase protein n=1 Tax=Pelagibacterium halotolerans (strain DSM 22347 / JCM 15775 / CGMCC 1.7692 / B2) TaxID=1082931 RepID=G4RDW0_PELHB|nr:site-specific integrase [Pelagibacterium halotolerans]AEQ53872.1 putative integrase/resolvase recombinase protein [Pelagibacterium halotolerans B2]QJR19983.1 site-specific integrase [Pelagibacterium halotolerans]SEA45487.1 hypothetical protein SAMN05428936_10428 [Pelagibacterium halotolerans]
MAAKCAYVEKVGAVYYVRKRIPRAWIGQVRGDVLRLSLRTKDRAEALKWGLEALAVFEDLLRMAPEEALKHLTQRLIDEQMLRPEEMTGADLVRRRALGSVGSKIIRRAREELRLGENLDGIYAELVHLNRATVEGEAYYDRLPDDRKTQDSATIRKLAEIDVSGFQAVLDELGGTVLSKPVPGKPVPTEPSQPRSAAIKATTSDEAIASDDGHPIYTLRYLMEHYFKHDGKNTGADNRSNIERAVKLFEDLCPEVRTLAAPRIPLTFWDRLYEFVQEIPKAQGRATPDNIVKFTRAVQAEGANYRRLSRTTLNSNYLGAITRIARYGQKKRLYSWQAPPLIIPQSKRATKSKGKAPFSPEEVAAVMSCPVYTGSASRRLRYSPGHEIFADDHIYWAPLIAAHTGMRVTEVGLLRFEQMQTWFGRQTFVLEIAEAEENTNGIVGYKTGNALRRIPLHRQLVEIGFLDFWNHQKALHDRPFPAWTQHVKGGSVGEPEIHFEADFFNAHRLKWDVPAHRQHKLSFHSFRGFFIQACHSAGVNPYTILKWVGHDDDTEARTSEVHRGYMSDDLTSEEVEAIDAVQVPIGRVKSFADWLKSRR